MILMKKLLLIIVILIGFCSIKVHAQVNDSIRISLLTCAPGTEIYSLFGHTAIRVEVPSRRIDLVYNYGMFSFRTPNFIYRFVKGETDYQLGIVPYSYFEMEYAERGSYVVQQELNLSQKEKERLIAILEENYLPQNRTYRYNYFYDNCTTRARDKIEESIEGKVIYQVSREPLTFREIVHRFTKDFPWAEFGIDLCLGSEADKAIDLRAQMFSPFVTMHAMDSAVIRTFDGSSHPLVKQSSRIVDPVPHPHEKEFPLSPMTCALILLALSLCISLLELRYKFATWWFDLILFGAQGIAGYTWQQKQTFGMANNAVNQFAGGGGDMGHMGVALMANAFGGSGGGGGMGAAMMAPPSPNQYAVQPGAFQNQGNTRVEVFCSNCAKKYPSTSG